MHVTPNLQSAKFSRPYRKMEDLLRCAQFFAATVGAGSAWMRHLESWLS